jgi:chromosome segregation ATPase
MATHLSDYSKDSAYPNIARVSQNAQEEMLRQLAILTSRAQAYEDAYTAEYYKLKQIVDINTAMGRDIEALRLKVKSLSTDLAIHSARNSELYEANKGLNTDLATQSDRNSKLREANEELTAVNEGLQQIIADLPKRVDGLEARSNAEDGKIPGLVVSSGEATTTALNELEFALKRRQSDGGDSGPRKKTRRRGKCSNVTSTGAVV